MIILDNKKEQITDRHNFLDGYTGYDVEQKKPVSKVHTLYTIICIKFLKRQNYRYGKQIRGCQGLRIVVAHKRELCSGIIILYLKKLLQESTY